MGVVEGMGKSDKSRLSSASQRQLMEQIEKWRDELLNLTRQNRALYFRHTRATTFEIVEPRATAIVERLTKSSKSWKFFHPPPSLQESEEGSSAPPLLDLRKKASANELVTTCMDPVKLDRGLKGLQKKSEAEFIDRGLWTLYLGVGMLKWKEAVNGEESSSPLILYPVSLHSIDASGYEVKRTEDDPILNPALSVKLESDFGIVLPDTDEFETVLPDEVLPRLRTIIAKKKAWTIDETVVLTTFSFHKEAMYRDLRDNAELVATHPLVRCLALGSEAEELESFAFETIDEAELDERVRPEDAATILDADVSQRQCIAAAKDGNSFVMDGPPGTGKSQTIANIIAELIYGNRTVLFVSEKAAALDVVRNRLEACGLGDFVLELHSHKATRVGVASALGRALSEHPEMDERLGGDDYAAIEQRRQKLTHWALAVNEIRKPLGLSLYAALGELSALRDEPNIALPESIDIDLSRDEFDRIIESAQHLAAAWAPVEGGSDFLWRGVSTGEVSKARIRQVEDEVGQLIDSIQRLARITRDLATRLGITWHRSLLDGSRLTELLGLLEQHRGLAVQWLTAKDFGRYGERVTLVRGICGSLEQCEIEVRRSIGDCDVVVSLSAAKELLAAEARILGSSQEWVLDQSWTLSDLKSRLSDARTLVKDLMMLLSESQMVGEVFGADVSFVSMRRLNDFLELGDYIGSVVPPESAWLCDPVVHKQLDFVADVLGKLVLDYRQRKVGLADTFTPEVLGLDLVGIRARFVERYKGFGRLSSDCRADRRALRECTVSRKVTKDVIARLDAAIEWQALAAQVERAESEYAGHLGSYYSDRESTDFERVTEAIEIAHRAVALLGQNGNHSTLASQISRQAQVSPEFLASLRGVRTQRDLAWERMCRVFGKAASALGEIGLEELQAWVSEVAEALEAATLAIEELGGGRADLTTGTAAAVARQIVEIDRLQAELADVNAEMNQLFEERYQGRDTPWDDLGSALQGAEEVRRCLGIAVNETLAKSLTRSRESPAPLKHHVEQVEHDMAQLLSEFVDSARASRAEEFRQESFESVLELLEEMRESVEEVETWAEFEGARRDLDRHGLGGGVAELEALQVGSRHVEPAIRRALLSQWIDAISRSDSRLKPVRSQERDGLIEEFQRDDRKLIANAAARIVNACSNRRPRTASGAVAKIKKQAELKRRHWPIQRLMKESGSVAQVLKPCFMMSPLSVSQFLPTDFVFDVVIFDEASQVRPSDAINCIYRGRQLIVAGDKNQLPPTDFFEATANEDEFDDEAPDEFESVLDLAKGKAALQSLSLNWHYRSQHEDLIAFSNESFYEGRLWTFPGAVESSDDLGVELIQVGGEYRRGTTRDNPIEAAKVVERIVYHRKAHPRLSIGVVTFSVAQEQAIEAEIERQRQEHAVLRDLTTDDRLEGFFVKNLESVQGDERDILIFSIGYGPDQHGKLTMNFGPLNRDGGWRRLNVAITRARRRLEVVSSVSAGDMAATGSEGLRQLRRYLDFAERGHAALMIDSRESLGDTESPFEEEVARCIRSMGYEVVPQVGVAGYRIDLGIRDPNAPGRFVLGVECDGAAYHSSRVARDRDRLRQQVLESLGWSLYRVWGLSWYRTRKQQEKLLRSAIDEAIADSKTRGRKRSKSTIELRAPVETREIDFDAPPDWSIPYAPAEPSKRRISGEVGDPESVATLRDLILEIVQVEVVAHRDLVMRTVRTALDHKGRKRLSDAFDLALGQLDGQIEKDDEGFLRLRNHSVGGPRVPTAETSFVRPATKMPPEELRMALVRRVEDAHSISRDDLLAETSRLFGWKRVGSEIREILNLFIEQLIDERILTEADGSLRLSDDS